MKVVVVVGGGDFTCRLFSADSNEPTSSAPIQLPSQSVHAIPSASPGPLLLQDATPN